MKIIIFCKKKIYKFFFEYLESIKKYVNYEILLFENDNDNELKDKITTCDISIFLQNSPSFISKNKNFIKKTYIINTEQLSQKKWLDIFHKTELNIIDYSLENISLLNKNILYFPYVINDKEIYNFEKTNDVCFIGTISPRRKFILDELKKLNIKVTIIKDLFMYEQDNILFRHKILINIHHNENYNIYESLRCDRCIFNKMIVITENSLRDDLNPMKNHNKIICVQYNDFIMKIKDVLNNYKKYYDNLFGDYDNFVKIYEEKNKNTYIENLSKMGVISERL